MLEWLEVRLDVGCDKRLVYEYRIEPLKSSSSSSSSTNFIATQVLKQNFGAAKLEVRQRCVHRL